MGTLDPRDKQIVCNKCGRQIGFFNDKGGFTQNDDVETFMRNRIYDVDFNGLPLDDHEFEIDLCNVCSDKWYKALKKFKATAYKVRRSTGTTNLEVG